MPARFLTGDVLEQLATLPDASVDLVFSSPPFLGVRAYLPADHPQKAQEMGSEESPGAYIDALLDVTEACARVLAPHGSFCFELGDTYSGTGGAGGDYNAGGWREGQNKYPRRPAGVQGWPLNKSLCLVPEIFRFALVYGFNPLTGRTTPQWRARNVVRWFRPNPPVGELGDKYRPATSDIVVGCKSARRYFDLDAVRSSTLADEDGPGAPPLDTWQITTARYRGSHYATFPEDLLQIPVRSMVPERVCEVCGEPSRRVTGDVEYIRSDGKVPPVLHMREGRQVDPMARQWSTPGKDSSRVIRYAPTTGWTDCGHNAWRRGVVLDPFAGTGTTLAVAVGHGRDAIGIDLDPRNVDLALQRCGMFLTVEEGAAV